MCFTINGSLDSGPFPPSMRAFSSLMNRLSPVKSKIFDLSNLSLLVKNAYWSYTGSKQVIHHRGLFYFQCKAYYNALTMYTVILLALYLHTNIPYSISPPKN